MAAQEITFNDVAAAAESLRSAGQPVHIGSLREALGAAASLAIHPHLAAWRSAAARPAPAEVVELPPSIGAALNGWAQQLREEAAGPLRDSLAQTQADVAALLQLDEQARAGLAERDARIERLTVELRHARDIASEALVGKAKDQLAIDGKDGQLAELRRQLERQVATSAAESDARLAAEMELVGAVTARDNFAAEVAELRAQLDARP
ncbi:MAG: DNA-binding protein [Burkholderiaceae bacterium]